MLLGVSFVCTNFALVRQHWQQYSTDKNLPGDNIGLNGIIANTKGVEPFIGGKFIILDWSNKQILWEIDIDGAAGFFIADDKLHITNTRLHYISVIDMQNKVEIKRISHPAFNCLHTLERTAHGYLAASTGTDSIIEIDENGKEIFSWWATDHGFNKLPDGNIRNIDKGTDHRHYVYPTLYHTTHLNSAVYLDKEFILTTLFHQGMLIKISRTTGDFEVLVSGLSCPHAAKKFNHGWVLSNTKANQLCLLDNNFKVIDNINGDYNWIQDNCPLNNTDVLLADANHHRIVEVNARNKQIKSEYQFSNNWRIYQIAKL